MSDIAVKLDVGPPWGSGSNQRCFDSLSVRWVLVDGSVPSLKSFFFLSLISHIRSWASQEALFLRFSWGPLSTNPVKSHGSWFSLCQHSGFRHTPFSNPFNNWWILIRRRRWERRHGIGDCQLFVTLRDTIFDASNIFDHCTQLVDTIEARELSPTVCLGSTKFLCLGQRLKYVNPLKMT